MSATILVADDDRSIRLVVSQALAQRGHAVRAASHARTLWQWVDAGGGGLVVTDVLMPDGNGLDLVPRIKERRPDLPIIVMRAQKTILTGIGADEGGVALVRPFTERRHTLPIIVMSAQNTILTAIRANERGAFEYLPKPFDLDVLVAAVDLAFFHTPPQRAPARTGE